MTFGKRRWIMAVFELVVVQARNLVDTVREVRKRSILGISEVRRRIGTDEPLITISTTDYPLEMDMTEGHRYQHALFLGAHEALVQLGDTVVILYRPSADDSAEEVDRAGAKNLMESELTDLEQEYD